MRQKKSKAKIKSVRKSHKAEHAAEETCDDRLGWLFDAVAALQTEVGELRDITIWLTAREDQRSNAAIRAAASVGGSFEQAQNGSRNPPTVASVFDEIVPAPEDLPAHDP